MPVLEHCRKSFATAKETDTIRDLAGRMERENVGCAFVVDDRNRPIGAITDRDIAMKVLRRGRDPKDTRVGDVMQREVTTLWESAPLLTAFHRMRHDGLRRIPVVDDGRRLVGVLEWDDALHIIADELEHAARAARAQSAPIAS